MGGKTKMKVLITGGAGYLGSWLVRDLIQKKHKVTVLDAGFYGFNSLKDIPVKIIHKDIRNITSDQIKNNDVIIHLASIVGDAACNLDPKETIEINFEATKNIANLCSQLGKKLIFSSTCSVYGTSPKKISSEDDKTVNPISLYGRTKLKSEEAIKKSGCDYSIFRLGTLFGLSYRMRFDLAINLFIAKAIIREKITVFGGDQWRPFLHVRDAADVFAKFLNRSGKDVFNVAFDNFKIIDVATKICEIFKVDYTVTKNIVDRRDYHVNCQKLLDSGWKTRRNIKDACVEIETAYNFGFWKNYKDTIYSNHKFLFENKELMKRVYTLGVIPGK